jgi:hypothetical protein
MTGFFKPVFSNLTYPPTEYRLRFAHKTGVRNIKAGSLSETGLYLIRVTLNPIRFTPYPIGNAPFARVKIRALNRTTGFGAVS